MTLRRTLPPAEEALLVVSADGTVLESDDTAQKIFGRVDGRPLEEVVTTPGPVLAELLADFRRSTGAVPGRLGFRTLTGEHLLALTGRRRSPYSEDVALAVRLGDDRFGELTDALDRTNVEIARRMEVEERLRLVWSQTAAQLAQAGDDLQRLGQGVAHDLRNPLTTIRGFVTLVADDPGLSEDSRAMLDRVARAAEGMEDIVEGLMRETDQRVKASRVEVPLLEVVEWVVSLVDDQVVRVEVEGRLPVVRVSLQAVRQLLLNLVSNAAKHRGRLDAVRVAVSATVRGERCEVVVSDDGPGVPVELREAVFEQGVSTQEGPAHGLGLAMCRHIVQEHGGEIALEESPAGGTLVRFTLPLATG